MAEENRKTENEFNEDNVDNEELDSQGSENEDKEENEPNKKNENNKGSKMFTQEQVNRMMTREKNQGRNAVYNELGINPKDTKVIAQFKAFIESQKTNDEKAAEKKAADEAKQNEAEQRAILAEAKAEAMMLGVKTQYVEDAVTLALAKKTDDADLKTLIGEFKTKYPIWFKEEESEDKGNKKVGQRGTGSSIKNAEKGNKKGEAEKGLGARLAAQRKSSVKKSSYWGKK